MRARLRSAARREFLAAIHWYLEQANGPTATRFEESVVKSIALLASQPSLGSPGEARTRRWPLKGFPYTVVYRVQDDELIVLAVAHQRRRPDYWR